MEIKHLFFAYTKENIIKDLSLNFKQGKITILLGSNGCGKSTLFKLCTRNLKPKMGTIKLDGKNISDINRKDFAKKVAIVKQKNRLDSDIKVEELVSYGRNPYLPFMARLTEKDYQKIDEAIKLCGLEEIRDKKVNLLSGGQTQRVWIAMAIAQDSDILFLDEPTTYLDIKYQIEILNLVKRLNKNLNKTIIMVLHDINQSIKYADEIVGMYKGKIVFNGKPKETLTEENISKIFDTKLKLAQLEGETIVLAREN